MYFDTRVPQGMERLYQDAFFASLDFTTGNGAALGAAGSATATRALVLTIDQDAHVLVCGGVRVTTDAATDQTLQAFANQLVTLKMISAGRELMNNPQHMENFFGTAQLPAAWPRPKFLAAGSSIRATLTNLAAAAVHVRLAFIGFKIFLGAASDAAAPAGPGTARV